MAFDRIWLLLQLNPPLESLPAEVKNLTDICIQKLISDSCLLRKCTEIPKTLYRRLLLEALEQSRTLSVSNLMKYYQDKELTLPVTRALKCWRSLAEASYSIMEKFRKFRDNAYTILNTFVLLVDENWPTSQLQSVDLGVYPWGSTVIDVLNNLLRIRKKHPFPKTYVLKCAFTLTNPADARTLLHVLENAALSDFHLLITGLNINNNVFHEREILDILDKTDPSEFLQFSMDFANIIPSVERTFHNLWSFKNLKYFNCSYLRIDFPENPSLLELFGKTLAELPNITHLLLRSNKLTGCMDTLLQYSCTKKDVNSNKLKTEHTHCCLVHNGLLEYLDLFACALRNEDILFLRKFQSVTSLKYLNVGGNRLQGSSAFETLLTLDSSLIALDVEESFRVEYNPEIFPWSKFNNLKFLNVKGFKLTPLSVQLLNEELEKMPKVIVLRSQERRREESDND